MSSSKPKPSAEPKSIYEAAAEQFGEAQEEDREECPSCGRKFNVSAMEKHLKICQKVFMQKRKVFDSKKMREV